jgi:ketosteroid isomerase-like protein
MTTNDETRRIVEGYFTAWTTKKAGEAYTFLAEDLEFTGPSARYHTAAEFKPGLEMFTAMTSSARVIELLIDGDRAAMLYDCELAPPIGTLRIASFFRVRNGKISSYETLFDPTEFNKLRQSSAGR